MSDTQQAETTEATTTEGDGEQQEKAQAFSQSDMDELAKKVRAEERRKASERFADYDDLKAKAGTAKTAEERIAALEAEVKASQHEALRRRVQAAHGISDEDADLFLTGADEDTLTAQAQRLADRESERVKQGNVVSKEGTATSKALNGDPLEQALRSSLGI